MIGRVFIAATSLAVVSVLATAPACCQTRRADKPTSRPTPNLNGGKGSYTRMIERERAERRDDDRRDLHRRQARAKYQADEAWKDDLDDDMVDEDE